MNNLPLAGPLNLPNLNTKDRLDSNNIGVLNWLNSISTMAATNTYSSSLQPQYYDVFLSFEGNDTRKNITDHLLAALRRNGFVTFIDDKLKRGEEIGPELLKTIEESRVAVIIFSRNYATSSWCLDELVKIMECRRTFQQMVLPIFYYVDPSDVRAQSGSFGESFGRHEEHYDKGKVERWRAALTQAANFSGWHLQNVADGHESKFIEKIVEDISNKLNLRCSNVVDYPIGMESRVQHVNILLSLGSNDVRMVGIWGIGGGGKTTVSKAIYNLIHHKFEGSSFLANVREISKQPNGLIGLQEQLLSDILMNEKHNIRNVDQGIELIKQRLWCKRVLVVLDDVDEFEQLNAFALRHDWFHPGSRIIATTRDESLLNWLKVDAIYEPELLTDNESLELFSWHAFRKDHPIEDYVELSANIVGYARGLPLVLKVLGCFLFDKTMLEWKDALEKLKVIPYDDIQEKLKISFDSLNDREKAIFLDIACFFVGMDQNYTIEILKGCGFFPVIGIGVLTRRCLVRIDELNQLTMHDMIRDMGREIVRRENPNESGERSRLWSDDDSRNVLKNHTGTKAVEGLILNFPGVQVNAISFAKMNNLRLLKLNNVFLSDNCYEHLSKELRWLYWSCFPLESIPSNLFMEEVVALEMPYSSLKQVWKASKGLFPAFELFVSLPNVELPIWSDFVSVRSDLSFVVPELKVREWALFVIYTINRNERVSEYDLHYLPPFYYTVKNKTKGFEKHYEPAIHEYQMIFNNDILLHFVKRPNLELCIGAGDKVELSVSILNPMFLVKKCGVSLFSDHMASSFESRASVAVEVKGQIHQKG